MLLQAPKRHADMSIKPPYFYKDKPVFGLDIGHGTIKVMQLETVDNKTTIIGYGTAHFDIKALEEGVIVDPGIIREAVYDLFHHHLKGVITTRRVAMALPAYRTFSRAIQLPRLSDAELWEAVKLEVEQYIPMPLDELYLDYNITRTTPEGMELFVIAVPKKIIDSYLTLAKALDVEPVLIEPTVIADSRFFAKDKNSNLPSIIIDFGSLTANVSIMDKTILTTSTVEAGGLVFTQAIVNKLGITLKEAGDIKTKFGLDKSMVQKDIQEALEPSLQKIVSEIRRIVRYYDEHYGPDNHVEQIITLGGGANMPGLANYLTDILKIPVRTLNNPWASFSFEDLKPPAQADRLMFITVAGLGLLEPKEVFAS
jgi:type IV pilus assembly protein PilM